MRRRAPADPGLAPGFDNDSAAPSSSPSSSPSTPWAACARRRGVARRRLRAGRRWSASSHGDGGRRDVAVSGTSLGFVASGLFVGAPWAAGLTIRLRREREAALGAENERLRVEQEERAARAVAEERSRIARELHDVVSHAISVTVLQARGARRTLDTDPAAARAGARRDRADQHRGAGRHAPAARGAARHRARRSRRRRARAAAVARPPRRPGRPRAELGRRRSSVEVVGDAPRRAAGRRPLGVPDRAGGADQRAQARRGRAHARSAWSTPRTR